MWCTWEYCVANKNIIIVRNTSVKQCPYFCVLTCLYVAQLAPYTLKSEWRPAGLLSGDSGKNVLPGLFKLLAEFSSCHIEWRFLFSWWMLTEGLSASRDCLKFSFTRPYPQPEEKCSSDVSLALHFMFMINFCVKGSFD